MGAQHPTLLARPEVVEPLIDQFSSDEAERRSGILFLTEQPGLVWCERAATLVNEVYE